MKRFITKSTLIILPIILLYIPPAIYFNSNRGDLVRLGYLADKYPDYRNIFSEEFKNDNHFTKVSEDPAQKDFEVMIVGDSFSMQHNYGYKTYLGKKPGLRVLYLDRELHDNPFQTMYSLLNGDFFDTYQIKYIVLQSAERYFTERISFDKTKVLDCAALRDLARKRKPDEQEAHSNFKFPSTSVFRFAIYNLLYPFDDNGWFSPVYKAELTDKYFSVDNQNLLFHYLDIDALETNNSQPKVAALNGIINDLANKLKGRGIKLIFLPSPDKYGIYYDYLVAKDKYPRPLFYELLDKLGKDYLYVDAKAILTAALKRKKDIYFYDDTHWSPWASILLADEIDRLIKSDS
ncbi:MAG: hypothetical protein JXA52_05655 [Planctomycetes bacterium]|nr:hypothetical protein [Planctomycetota bacterium]